MFENNYFWNINQEHSRTYKTIKSILSELHQCSPNFEPIHISYYITNDAFESFVVAGNHHSLPSHQVQL